MKTISILTPCYNEEGGIRDCYLRVREVMTRDLPGYDYEHVFIDNCSRDRTVDILREVAAGDRRVKVIVNSRNFGAARSGLHGILATGGDAVVPVLADLQTPPELIPKFVAEWEKGIPVVIAVRATMEQGFFLRMAREAFYAFITRVSNVEQIRRYMGFGLYDRRVIEAIRSFDDPDPYFRGLVAEAGFRKSFIEYHEPQRQHGTSSYTFLSLLDYALLGLTSYSKGPLRLMTILGVCLSLVSFALAFAYLVAKLFYWDQLQLGLAPLLIGTFFFASVQMLFIGLLGEYVGAIYEQVRHRPLVVEQERINFEAPPQRSSRAAPHPEKAPSP